MGQEFGGARARAQSIVSRQVSFDEGLQSKLSVGIYAARSLDGFGVTVDMGHPFCKLSSSMGLICVEAHRAPLVTIRCRQKPMLFSSSKAKEQSPPNFQTRRGG
ncbi:hypothetical protein MGYG_08961 [Nannizzia gypsea CBS 118893]|uniref:Uncharacterized protein n=1 Tax=Arthroderma gypseum (strain ATCC MYA-4604 / CBS 118893) TaxID=535722 RepID=E4UPR3_ARTGP|nr:hypothetical protein MGYG_08961 [Nannizzia gypsea CBS 118893]EFQ99100.1 hypothetical protein MGYG_08961 [Nannizzia gypsea CBS 118893]